MVLADDGVRSALDRLSSSLDRIHGLLTELYLVQQQRERGEAVRHECARPSSEANSAAPQQPQEAGAPPRREPGAPRPGEPRVVYGGGPSAFAAR